MSKTPILQWTLSLNVHGDGRSAFDGTRSVTECGTDTVDEEKDSVSASKSLRRRLWFHSALQCAAISEEQQTVQRFCEFECIGFQIGIGSESEMESRTAMNWEKSIQNLLVQILSVFHCEFPGKDSME